MKDLISVSVDNSILLNHDTHISTYVYDTNECRPLDVIQRISQTYNG